MGRFLALVYGVGVYLVFFVTFLYLIGFLADAPFLPKTIDTGAPAVSTTLLAAGINLILIALFGLQHSVMARAGFKKRWMRIVPQPAERSTYVLAASLVLILLMGLWQPMPQTIWSVEGDAGVYTLWVLFALGWGLLFLSTFLINHFDLFGLRQVWLHFRGRPAAPISFKTPGPYRLVRHPLYLGFVIAFWATPEMSLGHLLFAAGMTLYILVGIACEERDMIAHFGETYRAYRARVPMLIPLPLPRRSVSRIEPSE